MNMFTFISKENTTVRLGWMFLLMLLLSAFKFDGVKDTADLDPVAFQITGPKGQVQVGEEFEIKVVAIKRQHWDSRLGHSAFGSDYRLKVVFPEGFEQTGGNYSDYIYENFNGGKSRAEYTIRGRFTSNVSSATFMLLRGSPQSVELGRYVHRGSLRVQLVDRFDSDKKENARVTSFNQCLEAESMGSATGPVTSDPNASNGQTRGAETQYNHYVDYVVTGVPSAGAYQVTLRYYSSSAPIVSVTVNGTNAQTVNLTNSGSWNIVYTTQTFNVNLTSGTNTIRITGTGGGSCRQDRVCVAGSGEPSCTTPSAPSITKTSGTTVCAATNQTVTLTATGCSGAISWFKDGTQVGTGTTYTTTAAGSYTAKCTVSTCVSNTSSAITVAQTSGCGSTSTGCVVNKVRLQFRFPGECCMDRLVGAKIQGSNNGGTSWTDLYTFSANGNGSWQEFTFGNTTSYSSVRFVASNTGWGELAELEFYNGTTKLTGTSFGTGNYTLAFDNSLTTKWEGASVGSSNVAGLNLTGCGTPVPSAPTITKTVGTTACVSSNQTVTLAASGCSGTITWFRSGTQVATGTSYTTNTPGDYTAKCTVAGQTSNPSSVHTVAQTTGCVTTCTTPIAPTITKTAGTTVCASSNQSVTLTATGCSGTITWFKDGVQVSTGTTHTTTTAGSYTAKCTVGSCVSNVSNTVVITQTSGCGGGATLTPKISSSGFTNILNLSIVPDPANPGSWLISDIATVGLPSGYEWSYFVGNKWIKRSTNLVNEPWQTNSPGRVVKMATKIGLDTLNRWPCPPEGCSWYYQSDAVADLAPGARGGLTTFIFN